MLNALAAMAAEQDRRLVDASELVPDLDAVLAVDYGADEPKYFRGKITVSRDAGAVTLHPRGWSADETDDGYSRRVKGNVDLGDGQSRILEDSPVYIQPSRVIVAAWGADFRLI